MAAALHVQRAYKTIRANTSQPHCAAANAALAAARAARASTWTQEALGYVADALQHAQLWAADDVAREARRRMAAEALCALSGQGQGAPRRDEPPPAAVTIGQETARPPLPSRKRRRRGQFS